MPWAEQNKGYLRHLANRAYHHLGRDVTLFTTDPASIAARGSLPKSDVFVYAPMCCMCGAYVACNCLHVT